MYNFNYITLLKNLAFFQFEKKVKYFTFTHFTSKIFFLKYFYLNFSEKRNTRQTLLTKQKTSQTNDTK